ncbi:hypothetical protein HMN09_01086900 [Mycena chlorophos]|uniref:Uncharacterized protein n=1 Tax=Mycena chlorophos TaxID=658473 RepID=A0A8H6W1S1_MYCCL|nr:hypothetical protein HMN09_01086900 [Mycena chlorophos]
MVFTLPTRFLTFFVPQTDFRGIARPACFTSASWSTRRRREKATPGHRDILRTAAVQDMRIQACPAGILRITTPALRPAPAHPSAGRGGSRGRWIPDKASPPSQPRSSRRRMALAWNRHADPEPQFVLGRTVLR